MIASATAIARPRTLASLRILLADDHIIVRQAVKAMLVQEGMEVVGEASDGLQALKQCGNLQPDIAILDLSMPLLNGVEAAREIIKTCPKTRVLILTEHTHNKYILECLHVGVNGYVLKGDTGNQLVAALGAVSKGETYISPSLSRVIEESGRSTATQKEALGIQQRRVLRLIADGKNSKEIGELLGISYKTVQSHRTNIMNKLQIRDIASLVRYAISCRITEP